MEEKMMMNDIGEEGEKLILDDFLNKQSTAEPKPEAAPADSPSDEPSQGSIFDDPKPKEDASSSSQPSASALNSGGGGAGNEWNQDWGEPGKSSKVQAEAFTRLFDRFAAMGLNELAAGDKTTRHQYEADDSELEDIEYLTAVIIEYRHINWPPEVFLAILVLTVYGTKIPGAWAMRKKRKEAEENREKREASRPSKNQAPKPSSNDGESESVVEPIVEEVDELDTQLQLDLYEINQMAAKAKLPKLHHYEVPEGLCWYHYVIENVEEPANWGGRFKDLSASNKWRGIVYKYQEQKIPLPERLR